jgi:hypothetical protein
MVSQQKQGSSLNLVLVALAIWLLFFNGLTKVKEWSSSGQARDIATTIERGGQRFVATAQAVPAAAPAAQPTTKPIVAPAAVSTGAVVVPQSMPRLATATPPPPTAIPPTPLPEVQAVYDALLVEPTPIPLQPCEAGKETYITSPVQVLNPRGMPIGEARGRSCVSDQDAHDNANAQAQAVMDQDKQAHPEAWR